MPSEPQRRRGPPAGAAPTAEPDPLVAAFVDRAVAPYARVLPPEALEELREIVEAVLETHPAVAPVLDRLRRRPARSGARAKGDGEAR